MLMDTFASIISLWESAEQLASDLELDGAHPGTTVRAWKRRNSIPPEYWNRLVVNAERRGLTGVTLERLAKIAETSSAERTEQTLEREGEAAA